MKGLLPRERGPEVGLAWNIGEAPMGLDGPALAIEAEDLGPPRTRPCQPQEQADGGGLAGPIGPQVADNLTLRDLELKARQSPDSAVVLPKTLGADR
jgi:hypothetical protein